MFTQERIMIMVAVAVTGCLGGVSHADNLYKEAVVIGGYSDNEQWTNKTRTLKSALGFEYYRKFSDEYGDVLTLDLQVRTPYDCEEDGRDAFGVEIHNAWLEYKLGLGKSVRVGHFDPAFGLEPVVDTHGTLLQTLAPKSIGFKKDWGVGYHGMWGDFDYQVAAQLGSGMGIRRKDGSFLLTGRIGTPPTEDTQVGLSFLYGRTLESTESWTIPAAELKSDESSQKRRIGVDFQFPVGLCEFKAEAAVGDNDGTVAGGGMAELGYTVPELQALRVKMQTLYWADDGDEKGERDLTLAPVIEYELTPAATLRLGYFHDLYSSDDEDKLIVLQLYYFGL